MHCVVKQIGGTVDEVSLKAFVCGVIYYGKFAPRFCLISIEWEQVSLLLIRNDFKIHHTTSEIPTAEIWITQYKHYQSINQTTLQVHPLGFEAKSLSAGFCV